MNRQLNGHPHTADADLVVLNTILELTDHAVFYFDESNTLSKVNQLGQRLFDHTLLEVLQCDLPSFMRYLLTWCQHDPTLVNCLNHIEEKPYTICSGKIGVGARFFSYYTAPQLHATLSIGRLWLLKDITEVEVQQRLFAFMALHDDITGLPNRSQLISHLEGLLSQNHTFSLFMLSFEGYKQLSDISGFDAGNSFLRYVAHILKQHFSADSYKVGKLPAGDFYIVANDCAAIHAKALCDDLISIFSLPMVFDSVEFSDKPIIGYVCAPEQGGEVSTLIKRANLALHKAQHNPSKGYTAFNPSIEQAAYQEMAIERAMRDALSNNKLAVYFQPKVSLSTNLMVSAEALIRWPNNVGGYLYTPDEFIPIAEKTQYIGKITDWMLTQVCQYLAQWQAGAMHKVCHNITISVNISALDLIDPSFADRVWFTLQRFGIAGSQIVFEITERLFLQDMQLVQQHIILLRKMGIRFAIDDFGTGYSSLQYLQNLEVDYLKIDKSFIDKLSDIPGKNAIIKSIIDVATNLGLLAVAEGVESQAHLTLLKALNCHVAQGYLFSRPLNAQAFERYALSEESAVLLA